MADKKVEVEVTTEVEMARVEALEKKVNGLKLQHLQMKINADTAALDATNQKLKEAEGKLAGLKNIPAHLNIDVDDKEIERAEQEVQKLKEEKIALEISIEEGKLSAVKSEIDALDDEPIKPQVDNISAMEGIQQMADGFSRVKQSAMEVGQEMGELLESSGRMEQTETFLAMNLGADTAKKKLQEIRSVTDQLPGDDVTLQNLLSQAALKDASMTTEAFTQMGSAAADYMAAMQNFGKTSTETQQDLMNYILAGNTAEIERSPILQAHVDKLKEGTTVQERAKLLQEALNAEGWAGIASQDIYNNKFQQFNDMIERGKMNLGGVFQEGAKNAMDFIMKLDESTNGLVGMSIALGGFASPLADGVMGLGQMAVGFKALKDLEIIKWLKDLEIANKLAAFSEWLFASPILLVVLALALLAAGLIWAYYNVDWFREGVDNAWASLVQLGQYIYGVIMGAIQWLANAFQQFTSQLGLNTSDWTQAILGFILFLPTLPLRVAAELANVIARALGFKGNFVSTLLNTALEGVNNFANTIRGIPQALENCLNWAYNIVMSNPLVQALQWLGEQAVNAFSILGLGQGSPGNIVAAMENELKWTKDSILKSDLADTTAYLGASMAESFDPNLETANATIINGSLGGQGGDMIFNLYGDMDAEARMRKFVDAVRREIAWNNKTAGRDIGDKQNSGGNII